MLLQVTQEGKAFPGFPSEALSRPAPPPAPAPLQPPQKVGLLPQQFKAPTDSRQPHPPWVAERGRPGVGVGAPRLPADKLHLLEVLLSPQGDPQGQLGGWVSGSLTGPWPADLCVCICMRRAGCRADSVRPVCICMMRAAA